MTGQRSQNQRRPTASRRQDTLRLLALAGVALLAGLVLTWPEAPRPVVALAGGVLAFGVPGLALTRAMFPGPGLGRAERIAIVLGIQLSLTVLCGFLLHLLPAGLTAASWGALLADITLVACAAAWIRGRWQDHRDGGMTDVTTRRPGASVPGDQPAPSEDWVAAFARTPTWQLGLLLGAGLLAAIALAVARVGAVVQPQPSWTALSIVAQDAGRAVSVGVTNAEGHQETYRLAVTLDGQPLATFDAVSVADDSTQSLAVALPAGGTFLRRVEASLWRSGDPVDSEPYRSVGVSLRGVTGP